MITLGIIGVVAAMTIPTLLQNYQKERTAAQLKATFSILSQAFQHAVADYGDIPNWSVSNIYGQTSGGTQILEEFMSTYLLPYIKVTKDYGKTSLKDIGYKALYYMNGSKDANNWNSLNKRIIVLANGSLIAVSISGNCEQENGQCVSDWWYGGFMIITDINGIKGPNTYGKDVFKMILPQYETVNKNKFVFSGTGSEHSTLQQGCSKSGNGESCGALIQQDGWKINYEW